MAIKLDPTDAPTQNNLGALYDELGRHEEASSFPKAYCLDRNYASAEYNLVQIFNKNFKIGWKQRDSRWKRWKWMGLPFIETSRPIWMGRMWTGFTFGRNRVLVMVMFASTFNELTSKCNSLVVACAPRLQACF